MKARLLIAVVALQAAWVISTAAKQELALRRGTVVLLESGPVDPRDLLRGDYVILSHKISVLPATLFAEGLTAATWQDGTPVFVRLEKRGEFHEAVAASFSPLDPTRGIRSCAARSPVGRGAATIAHPIHSVWVEYGLERYYVREGTGRPSGKITVEAVVTPSGTAFIRQVYIDGQPYADAMRKQGR